MPWDDPLYHSTRTTVRTAAQIGIDPNAVRLRSQTEPSSYIPLRRDNGIEVYTGYRVQHNDTRGSPQGRPVSTRT